jgi:hypothetical protein
MMRRKRGSIRLALAALTLLAVFPSQPAQGQQPAPDPRVQAEVQKFWTNYYTALQRIYQPLGAPSQTAPPCNH